MIYLRNSLVLIFLITLIMPLSAQSELSVEEQYLSILQSEKHERNEFMLLGLKTLAVKYPWYARLYRVLIESFIMTNKIDEAKQFFNDLVKIDSTNGYAYYCLSRIYSHRKEYEQAIIFLKKCISLTQGGVTLAKAKVIWMAQSKIILKPYVSNQTMLKLMAIMTDWVISIKLLEIIKKH